MAALGIFSGIAFLLVGIVQIFVGYIGIEYHLGTGFAIGALALGFLFRVMLPLTIGTFFGAMNVWGWPWYGAAALAAPGLMFMLPALITGAVGTLLTSKKQSNPSENYRNETSVSKPKNVTPKKAEQKIIKKITKVKKSIKTKKVVKKN